MENIALVLRPVLCIALVEFWILWTTWVSLKTCRLKSSYWLSWPNGFYLPDNTERGTL